MTRFLLIFALLIPGLRPGLPCDHAQVGADAVASQACVACCPTDRCQADECGHPVLVPQTPATPPRGGDVAPPLLLIDREAVDQAPLLWTRVALQGMSAHRLGHEQRRFESVVCRWLT